MYKGKKTPHYNYLRDMQIKCLIRDNMIHHSPTNMDNKFFATNTSITNCLRDMLISHPLKGMPINHSARDTPLHLPVRDIPIAISTVILIRIECI
jgi:hypothetical protein